MAKIKVRSIDHRIIPIGSVGYGVLPPVSSLTYMGVASSMLTLPLRAAIGSWYNVNGEMAIFNGSCWEQLGNGQGSSPGPSYEEYPEDKIQIQVPASYWSDGQRKARVTSTIHHKPLRGEMRMLTQIDELGFFPQPASDTLWKIDGVDEALTRTKLEAMGISPSFFEVSSYGPLADSPALAIMEEYVNLHAQKIMDRVTRELSDSLIYGTTVTKPNYAGLLGGGI